MPVELYDERFTTRMAARTPGRTSEDSRAAAHLLEGWLAAHERGRRMSRTPEEREAARLERERRRAGAPRPGRAPRRGRPSPRRRAQPAPAAGPEPAAARDRAAGPSASSAERHSRAAD